MHLCYNKKYKSTYRFDSYSIEQDQPGIQGKPIFCFVIHPDYQRMGVTTQMVHQICEDAATEDFYYVKIYVHAAFVSTIEDFRGPIGMHEKCGFLKIGELNGKAVMRKKLK